jgi:hypothetical protein
MLDALHPLTKADVRVGRVLRINGSVVDLRFAEGQLPPILNALTLDWDGPHPLLLEVQQHLDPCAVRAVALAETSGCSPSRGRVGGRWRWSAGAPRRGPGSASWRWTGPRH